VPAAVERLQPTVNGKRSAADAGLDERAEPAKRPATVKIEPIDERAELTKHLAKDIARRSKAPRVGTLPSVKKPPAKRAPPADDPFIDMPPVEPVPNVPRPPPRTLADPPAKPPPTDPPSVRTISVDDLYARATAARHTAYQSLESLVEHDAHSPRPHTPADPPTDLPNVWTTDAPAPDAVSAVGTVDYRDYLAYSDAF